MTIYRTMAEAIAAKQAAQAAEAAEARAKALAESAAKEQAKRVEVERQEQARLARHERELAEQAFRADIAQRLSAATAELAGAIAQLDTSRTIAAAERVAILERAQRAVDK